MGPRCTTSGRGVRKIYRRMESVVIRWRDGPKVYDIGSTCPAYLGSSRTTAVVLYIGENNVSVLVRQRDDAGQGAGVTLSIQ